MNYRHVPRSVEFIENNKTVDCNKSRELPAKCALCFGIHTAYYKGFLAYINSKNILRQETSYLNNSRCSGKKYCAPVAMFRSLLLPSQEIYTWMPPIQQ